MNNIITSHHSTWSPGIKLSLRNERLRKVSFSGYFDSYFPSRGLGTSHGQYLAPNQHQRGFKSPIFSSTLDNPTDPDDSEDGINNKESSKGESGQVCS